MSIINLKHCQSCGYPMLRNKDFGGRIPTNSRCLHCCNEDGSHKTFSDVLNGQIDLMLSEDGRYLTGKFYKSRRQARKDAIEYLSRQPAWKNYIPEQKQAKTIRRKKEINNNK